MAVANVPTAGNYPRKLSKREAKVIEAAAAADGALVQTLTNKTIDGDDNTVKDLPVTSLKTVVGNADKVVMGTSTTGVPKFDKITEANVATVVGNADKVLMGTSATGVPKFDKIGAVNIDAGAVGLAALSAGVAPAFVIKFFVLGSTITGSTLTGLQVGDLVLTMPGNGPTTIALCAAPDTLPADPDDAAYLMVLRAAS